MSLINEEEERLRECLLDRYLAGAKTLVLSREETAIVLELLTNKKQIRAASEIAREYIMNYLDNDE